MNAKLALALLWVGILAGCGTPDSGGSAAPAAPPAVDYRNSRAEVVVLSFFDMYCPHCQRTADEVNRLHALVKSRGLGSRIEFFAIGWNNSEMEAEMYRKRFQVPFAVVPDRSRAISSRFGNFRPPLLIALRKEGGTWREFYRTRSLRGDPEAILAKIQP